MALPFGFLLAAAYDDGGCTDPAPDGPPTSVETYSYGGGKVGVQWVNGDTTDVVTDISIDGGASVEHAVAAGITSKDLGTLTSGEIAGIRVRHRSCADETAWVAPSA